jgi:hypothetical protein
MTTLVLIADAEAGQPLVGPESAARLGRMGFSHITLLRDRVSTAVVLEGWAFNPAEVDDALHTVFADGGVSVRAFHEVEQVVIANQKGRDLA